MAITKEVFDFNRQGLMDLAKVFLNKVRISTIPALTRQKAVQPKVSTTKITSYESYVQHASLMQSEYDEREQFERCFTADLKPFWFKSFCYVCNQKAEFYVDYLSSYKKNGVLLPNWRERLVCPKCELCNRSRASIHLFDQLLHPDKESRIYISEQIISLVYEWFDNNYSNVIGSEYLGETIPLGAASKKGVRNEDLTELSFSNNYLDFIIAFDVFEHIPDFQKAFRECFRVLKPKGILFFTVPFRVDSEKNIVRAVVKEDNRIEHLLLPEYHGGLQPPLAFYHFGWEMLSQLEEIGFSDVGAYLYWSKEFGYLGEQQVVFLANKNGGE